MIKAVFFDFGGVILSSPFVAFAKYERDNDLPAGLISLINTSNPDNNAWAKLERSEVDMAGFAELFESEARELGHLVDGTQVVSILSGSVRPEMVRTLETVKSAGFVTACLTNNFVATEHDSNATAPDPKGAELSQIMRIFDHVVQSSKIGIRKPEIGFYEYALGLAGVSPNEVVFLDDLGMNLKPARSMGMTTIKVVDPDSAILELAEILGVGLP